MRTKEEAKGNPPAPPLSIKDEDEKRGR